jgi:hypothetical protein
MYMRKSLVLLFIAVVSASALSGCGVHLLPSASATLLASNDKTAKAAPVGGVVTEKDCYSSALFYLVGFGDHRPSHERLVAKILEQYKADVLLGADLSYTEVHIPFIYQSHCAKIKGQPARFIAESEVKK